MRNPAEKHAYITLTKTFKNIPSGFLVISEDWSQGQPKNFEDSFDTYFVNHGDPVKWLNQNP